jgi:hypothetical protein
LRFLPFLLLIVVCTGSLSPGSHVRAQAVELPALLWELSAADILPQQAGHRPELASHVLEALPISLHADAIVNLAVGQWLDLVVGDDQRPYRARITEESVVVNGDRIFRGTVDDEGRQYALVLTSSDAALFGQIETADAVWQLHAVLQPGTHRLMGWVYRSSTVLPTRMHNDYVIPERPQGKPGHRSTPGFTQPRQALLLEGQQRADGSDIQSARTAGIHGGNLQITQSFDRMAVIAGESLQVTYSFRNISTERHQSLLVTVYFLLENTTMDTPPAGCSRATAGGQPVLDCQLGDFSPGETRHLSIRVKSSEASAPWIYSTAVVGNLRHDAYISVVQDVLLDSDGDGISDFNERLLGTDPYDPLSVDRRKSIIDVMALYTPDASEMYSGQAESRINQLIGVANQIYADSGIDIILRPVHHRQVAYTDLHDMDTMLDDLTQQRHPAFGTVPALRETFGADLVMLFRPQRQERDRCGLANLGGFRTRAYFSAPDERDYAYSVIAIDCPITSVLAHELGHNMGLTHSHREDGEGGTLPYATGHGVDGSFVTVMAFPGAYSTDHRIARFSSPQLACLGHPCGLDHREAQGADAVRALNLVRHQIAAYYPARVPLTPVRSLGSLSGQATDARIASGAMINEGLTLVQTVDAGERFSILADFQPDSRHAGLLGNYHVLVGLGNDDYYSVTEAGPAAEPWDGTLEGLVPYFRTPRPLGAIDYFHVLGGLQVDASFRGQLFQIFFAYSIKGTDELIYTREPLLLQVR